MASVRRSLLVLQASILASVRACRMPVEGLLNVRPTLPISWNAPNEPTNDVKLAPDEDDASLLEWHDEDIVEQQRELNDNLALIRILDDPPPFGEFGPFASDAALGSSRQRRNTLLNFIAFCLTSEDNTVAIASTIQRREHKSNQLVLHVARSTGFTTLYERECAQDFLRDIRRAWTYQSDACVQLVWARVIQMTEPKLRKRLEKLRTAMRDLQGPDGFVAAVDAWGKEENSPNALRWMNTWQCQSKTKALKDVFYQLSILADGDDFDSPYMYSPQGRFRLQHSYFLPISVLTDSTFLRDVEFGQTSLAVDVVDRIRRLRRRCLKLWCYEVGVHLLCSHARDSVHRILGPGAFTRFLCEDQDDSLQINWLESPNAVSEALPRMYCTAQDALLGVLAGLSEGSDYEEPFACNIAHNPVAAAEWTPWCIATYHPELQVIDYLQEHRLRASPAYIGCAKLACRACRFYVDQVEGYRWMLNTGGLGTMDLAVPDDWLMPQGEAGEACAAILREEAARLVLREDNAQRVAWELRHISDIDNALKAVPAEIPPLDISQ